jgi:hypothetical protein
MVDKEKKVRMEQGFSKNMQDHFFGKRPCFPDDLFEQRSIHQCWCAFCPRAERAGEVTVIGYFNKNTLIGSHSFIVLAVMAAVHSFKAAALFQSYHATIEDH